MSERGAALFACSVQSAGLAHASTAHLQLAISLWFTKNTTKKRVPVLRLVSSSGNGGGSRSHRNEKSLKKFLWHKNKNQRNLFRGATAAATAAKNVVTPLLHTDQQQLLPLPLPMPLSLPLPLLLLLLFSLLLLLLLPPEPRPSLLWQQQLLL